MTIKYRIDENLLIVAAEGPFTVEEVIATFGRAMVDPDLNPPTHVLLDGRCTQSGPSNEEIEALASHLGKLKAFFGGRWAMVADPNTLMFGLSRVLCCLAEPHGLYIEPFSSYSAAVIWLRQPHEATDANASLCSLAAPYLRKPS